AAPQCRAPSADRSALCRTADRLSRCELHLRPAAIRSGGARACRRFRRPAAWRAALVNRLLWSAAILLLIAVLLLSLAVGRVWLPPTMLLGGLLTPEPNLGGLIVIELRAPRTLLGLMVGA